MQVTIREINYKTVEVPDDYTVDDIANMIQNCEVVVGDTTDSEYECRFSRNDNWHKCEF